MTIELAPAPCNFNDYVAPGHFNIEGFELCPGFSIDEEFDLLAPMYIYFAADSSRKAAAHRGLKELQRLKHPLVETLEAQGFQGATLVEDVLARDYTPDHLEARYNALMFALAESVIPGVESYIDPHGAYSFRHNGDITLLAGDASGAFGFYETAKAVRSRLKAAL